MDWLVYLPDLKIDLASVRRAYRSVVADGRPRRVIAFFHKEQQDDIRALPGFVRWEVYASRKPYPGEIGSCETTTFVPLPDGYWETCRADKESGGD